MQVREIELKIEKLTRSFKIRRVKEKWSVVKFGDKEFVMTKELAERFTSKIYRGSIFHFYFDGDKVILEDPYLIRTPVGTNREAVKEYRFVVLDENVELWNPERFNLITKENGLALYTTDDDRILYRNGKRYTIFFRYDKRSKFFFSQTVIFDTEKPLNEETFNLIKRLHDDNDEIRHVRYDIFGIGFEIGIFDDDVDVYVGENHYIMVLDNAEIVKFIDSGMRKLVAIKGNKTYLELNKLYAVDEVKVVAEGKEEYRKFINRYRTFNYDINPTNILKNENDKVIAEIPSLDTEIKVKKFIINVKPMLIDTNPKTWHYERLKPKLTEEKTYKLRELVRKLNDEDRKPFDYRVDINLAVNA